jgi:hypothetical protein
MVQCGDSSPDPFDKRDNFLYNGPLLVFKDEDFECLRNAEAVVQLLWGKIIAR